MILSLCEDKTILNCNGSIIFLAVINRLMPYVIVMLTQIEQYKYLSYKLDAVGFRCVILNISTILSFIIYFFINKSSCYETIFGQFIYILLLAGKIFILKNNRNILFTSFRFICIINFTTCIRSFV